MLYANCEKRITRMSHSPLIAQTIYSELLERSALASFHQAFPEKGTFISKSVKGRNYWYFQTGNSNERRQEYVGPETPELLEQIAHHKEARSDERERQSLVSTLVRSFRMPRPIAEIGQVLEALAQAGIFRLRGVLVGTVAYQTYSAMLGVRLPFAVLQTGDIDIAQFTSVSVAVEDSTPPILTVLREVDPTFREVPHTSNDQRVARYAAKGGLRIDFLTPNEGADTDQLQRLPAYQTDAQPLRFLDYLIHEPEPAIALYGAGIYVHVPAPERYAIHKLIVSQRRHSTAIAKKGKDLKQAESLLSALSNKRPHELKLAWHEAYGRGQTWRRLLAQGMRELSPKVRDETLRTVDAPRSALPGVDLTFNNPRLVNDFDRDIVTFVGESLGSAVHCAISHEAIMDHFDNGSSGNDGTIETVRENRSVIETLARAKFLHWPVEEPESVLIRTEEISKLKRDALKTSRNESGS